MIKNFEELIETVKAGEKKTVAIAAAQTPSALEAAIMAKKENLADSVLTGDKIAIEKYIKELDPEMEGKFEIYDTGDDLVAAAEKSVELIHEGKAHLILKGKCNTETLLKAVLNKEKGLRTGNIMSDVLAIETPDRIVLMGDGGFCPLPDLKEKVSIVKNCVKVAHSFGCEMPKVAMLTHSESVNPKIQSTVDAAVIAKMNQRGQIKDCIIDGPFALDNAICKVSAEMKGIKSEVAGDADVLVVANIEAGNLFGKTMTYYCKFRVAHVVMGAKVPILIASRADTAEIKYLTMAMGILSA
ncbi:MAG: phosphate acetyltransferase [Candidatus Cloacimonadota bacterium]|nr:MAG: phosphate acetyltransferase [Candidatus Cloacimonadota bacterium]